MADIEMIQAEFADPVLVDLLDGWMAQLNEVVAMRQASFDRATRTGAACWGVIYEEVIHEYQPIVDGLVREIIKIEGLRPPPMIRLKK